MGTGFGMDRNIICAGFCKRRDHLIRFFNHQMNIQGQAGYPFAGLNNDGAIGNIRDKLAIHHINVDPVSTGVLNCFDVKAGVALNPATPLSGIEYIIDQLDFVLIMSVNPGFGGQKFIDSSVEKIKSLSALLKKHGSDAIIQVDGGVNMDTIKTVHQAGATSFVAGSAIFNTPDYTKTIADLRKAM